MFNGRTKLIIAATVIASLSFFFFEGTIQQNDKQSNKNSKKDLFRTLFDDGALFIYSSQDNPHIDKKNNTDRIRFGYRDISIKLLPDTAADIELLKNNSLIVTGTPENNIIFKLLFNKLGIDKTDKTITFGNYKFSGDSLSVSFFVPNPFNKNKLCIVLSSNDNIFDGFSGIRMLADVEIFNGNTTIFLADIDYSELSKDNLPLINIRDLRTSNSTYDYGNKLKFVIHGNHINKNKINKIADKYLNKIKELKSALDLTSENYKIETHIYQSFEKKGLMTNNTSLSNISDNSIQTVLNEDFNGIDLLSFNKLLINQMLGKAKNTFISEGMAAYFSDNWRDVDKYEIASRIIKSGLFPRLTELMNNNYLTYESDFSYRPLGALFTEFIIQNYGYEFLKEIYSNGIPGRRFPAIESKWNKYIKIFANNYKINRKAKIQLPDFLRGFCFAHEGYQIHNGYLSEEAVRSLRRLKDIGTNSISITPFTGMRNPTVPNRLRIWRSAGSENDESIIFISNEAKKLGMITLLKPHIYIHKSWPGAIKFSSKEEWNKFFQFYSQWIKHYALIAQIYNIPVFVIGNELSESSLNYPDKWRELISSIRKIYDGYITYGANWGKETENIQFWNDLDFIGVSEYYPLSDKDYLDKKDLKNGIKEVMDKLDKISKKFNRDIIFTEIGFRSSDSPWMMFREKEESKRKINYNSQKYIYEIIFPEVIKFNTLKGMFIWKWPSYLSYNVNQYYDAWTPLNKPAERVIERYYKKM